MTKYAKNNLPMIIIYRWVRSENLVALALFQSSFRNRGFDLYPAYSITGTSWLIDLIAGLWTRYTRDVESSRIRIRNHWTIKLLEWKISRVNLRTGIELKKLLAWNNLMDNLQDIRVTGTIFLSILQWQQQLNTIYEIGYTISLIALLLSLAILTYFR